MFEDWDEIKLETLLEYEQMLGPQLINCDLCSIRFYSNNMIVIPREIYGGELWVCPECYAIECLPTIKLSSFSGCGDG